MTDLATITSFFGWCSIINGGIFLLAAIVLMAAGNSIASLHSRLFDLSPSDLPGMYFQYLGQFKTLVLIFNITPYLALRLLS